MEKPQWEVSCLSPAQKSEWFVDKVVLHHRQFHFRERDLLDADLDGGRFLFRLHGLSSIG
jgi:hypothetical protein